MSADKLFETLRLPPQTDPPRSPRETLPTMYDLPSEDPKEPGLPDEFHYYQPQLLRETFQPPQYAPEHFFVGTDLNLYYYVRRPMWHKRPDWFAVLGVSRLYDEHDLRMSYVIWQEGTAPYLIVELLSPGTEQDDLGRTQRGLDEPPTKWEVYEQILRVPYYVVFSRYTDVVHYFVLNGGGYRPVQPDDQRLWLPDAGLGLGLWSGYPRLSSENASALSRNTGGPSRSVSGPSRSVSGPSGWQPSSKRSGSNRRSNMDSPSYHPKKCDMTPLVQRIMICLVVLMWVGLSCSLTCAAETSQVGSATKQVESGAKQVGRSVEDTAKNVGNTVVEGAKVAGEKVQDARRAVQPQAEDTFNKVKDGAESAGTSVKNFVNRLFGK